MKVSLVIPTYNEEDNIYHFYKALLPVINPLPYEFEIIFIDDGSTDRTFARMTILQVWDKRVRILGWDNNRGGNEASFEGLKKCTGDVAIDIACDLQDPPSIIPKLLNAGRDIVYGVGKENSFQSKLFNLTMGLRYAGVTTILLSRKAIDLMNKDGSAVIIEANKIPLPRKYIHYKQSKRLNGNSKWSFIKKVKLFFKCL